MLHAYSATLSSANDRDVQQAARCGEHDDGDRPRMASSPTAYAPHLSASSMIGALQRFSALSNGILEFFDVGAQHVGEVDEIFLFGTSLGQTLNRCLELAAEIAV